MRTTPITVILMLWTTQRLTQGTLPISFLLSLPPPPPTQKVLSTYTPFPASSPNPFVQHNNVQSQELKLHKLGHSTFVSTYSGDGSRHHVIPINDQQSPVQRKPDAHAHKSLHLSPEQESVSATNHGPAQKTPSYHQPVPLTFPPSSPSGSSSSSDSYNLPKIISLPPYPSQQLPQSSAYSTSSSSYSFSQGFKPIYGPPKTTKIVRHVSVFVAPPQDAYSSQNRPKIRIQGDAEKHVNIIFIKNPERSGSEAGAEIELPPSPEAKTYVYVLNKGQDGNGLGNIVVNTPEPPKYNPPDVYFIRYKDGQNQQGQHQQQQYGAAPTPSKEHQPSAQYGAPSNQNFTYTLPSSLLPTSLSRLSSNTTSNSFNNNTISINLSSAAGGTKANKNALANDDYEKRAESHFHLHNLNYFTSHHSQKEQNKAEEEKHKFHELELKQGKKSSHQAGLYSEVSRDISRLKDDDDENEELGKAKQHNKREQKNAAESKASLLQGIATTTLAPPPPPPPLAKYETMQDIIGEEKRLSVHNNGTSGSNGSFGDNNANIRNSIIGDDTRVLTKPNLTTLVSGDLEEKGSTRNVSGRPDDFRPYKYAPAMGYNYFGVIGYKIVD